MLKIYLKMKNKIKASGKKDKLIIVANILIYGGFGMILIYIILKMVRVF